MNEVAAVLAGPRGRFLCAEVACRTGQQVQTAFFHAARHPEDPAAVAAFVAVLRDAAETPLHDPAGVETADAGPVLLACLADAVAHARYWQEPDDDDAVLALPQVTEALAPFADRVLRSPATRWWRSPMDGERQWCTQWLGRYPLPEPKLAGAAQALRAWHTDTVTGERRAPPRPETPVARRYSGHWWSTPSLTGLVGTSRALPWLGAVHLMLAEDDMGWAEARLWPVSPGTGHRVYEITGPEAWASLVARYPLRVTRSRWHDWGRATGRTGEWLIPDWQAVSADHDAVHLTLLGYLTTAGLALDVGDGATVLAGWHPDLAYWLTDVLQPAGQPVDWCRQRDDDGVDRWQPVAAADRAWET